jgi:uncharacterized membrane protein
MLLSRLLLTQRQLQNPKFMRLVISKWLLIFLIIIAGIGFTDSTYLTVEHYTNSNPPCFIGSCELVLTSSYSTVAGIPVALFGMAYYLFILVALLVFFDSKKETALRIGLFSTVIGFIVSVYLFFLQASVIHAFCQYCLGSAATSTILFIAAVCIIVKSRRTLS